MVSTFVLQKAIDKDEEQENNNKENVSTNFSMDIPSSHTKPPQYKAWSIEKLRSYFSWLKEKFHPKLSDQAVIVLQKYYQLQRASDIRTTARTTIRLLESLTRLSQAHARLMMKDKVELDDAIIAICIVEMSLASTSTLGFDSALHSSQPKDPNEDYLQKERAILKKLNLM